MEPFITYKEKDVEGNLQYYVLQRSFPHYQAIILNAPVEGAIVTVPVSGYHLYLTFAGTIRGNYLLAKADTEKELFVVFEDMARWFYINMVLANSNRYKKFKI